MKTPDYYLNGLINNNEAVVAQIYQKMFSQVLSFVASNKGQRTDAEDVFQKALLQLAVRYKKEKFVIQSTFEAYFFTVCKNLWRRELNKSKIWVTKHEIVELRDDNEDIAMAVLEQKRWELYTESLELISEKCKQILKHYFSKVSYEDMVIKFSYSSETVARQSVFKCKNRLKTFIKKDKRFSLLSKL
ncbi:sigma-70 family RNA polymerase sigma factor [uncultured Psychroserpens sp.]|uniref:RNA polymerase sigma factor n=1 Tax=uncultured Psychroserpens sp. TaxID=255436 RepID=UPI0026265740|nr:sigma-70 family RNA polymerase sigma factor [uncultured Psychroserpens sp.]